jgi:hypothetical protein
MLPDRFGNLLSSFSEKSKPSETGDGWLENKATISLTSKAGIFSRYKFPGVSFENAASEGLSAARPEKKPRSIEQLIAAASRRQRNYGITDGSSGGEAALPPASAAQSGLRPPGARLRDTAKVLVNKPAPGRTQTQGGGATDQRGTSFVDVALEAQLDDAFIDAATNVVTPTVTEGGLIALNFIGLREFALMVSPTSNKIQVLDLNTGTTLTMSRSAYEDSASGRGDQPRSQGNRRATSAFQGDHPIKKVLKALQDFVEDVLLHPLALGAFLLLALGWGAFGLIPRWR